MGLTDADLGLRTRAHTDTQATLSHTETTVPVSLDNGLNDHKNASDMMQNNVLYMFVIEDK